MFAIPGGIYANDGVIAPAPFWTRTAPVDPATLILEYRYLFLFPLAFFEGPIVSFIVGFFVSTGHFEFVPAYLILLAGDLVPDAIYFGLGRHGESRKFVRRIMRRHGIGFEQYALMRRLWHVHGVKTMFLSKLAYGLSTPFLISAGLVGLPWRRYLPMVMTVSAIQYAILLSLGYYFGNQFGVAEDIFWWVKMGLTVTVVGVASYFILGSYLRKRLLPANTQPPSD